MVWRGQRALTFLLNTIQDTDMTGKAWAPIAAQATG